MICTSGMFRRCLCNTNLIVASLSKFVQAKFVLTNGVIYHLPLSLGFLGEKKSLKGCIMLPKSARSVGVKALQLLQQSMDGLLKPTIRFFRDTLHWRSVQMIVELQRLSVKSLKKISRGEMSFCDVLRTHSLSVDSTS